MSQPNLAELESLADVGKTSLMPDKIKITVGLATCGRAAGADAVFDSLQQRIEQKEADIVLDQTGCIGFCQKEPLVDVRLPGSGRILFTEMNRPRARGLVDSLVKGNFPGRLQPYAYINKEEPLIHDYMYEFSLPAGLDGIPALDDKPFFARQKKIVLRNCGYINPASLAEYIAQGGYSTLAKTLSQSTPEQVVSEMTKSGLRGRGGGGFPTGQKWQVARDCPEKNKFVICNGDEGDPGAYMDRTVLESDPHSVIEGIIIGAFAVGAQQGYIYIRDEYPLAVQRWLKPSARPKTTALLGKISSAQTSASTSRLFAGQGPSFVVRKRP